MAYLSPLLKDEVDNRPTVAEKKKDLETRLIALEATAAKIDERLKKVETKEVGNDPEPS